MNRRNFLASSAGALGAFGAPLALARPCPVPELNVDGGAAVRTECKSTLLADAAADMSVGQSRAFMQSTNPNNEPLDIQWQPTTGYYDSLRGEMQYMGKPASGQSTTYSHHIYDEAANAWRDTQPRAAGLEGTGHIWNSAFDPETGDYYHIRYQNEEVFRMTRASGAWSVIARVPDAYLSSSGNAPGPWPGTAWHPNLFGRGDPGFILRGNRGVIGWRKRTGAWQSLGDYSTWNFKAGGDYVYFADIDAVVMGTGYPNGGEQDKELIRIDAGSGGVAPRYRVVGQAPLWIAGRGQDRVGKMVAHPLDPTKLIILEEKDPNSSSSAKWWISADRGATWREQSTPHPFRALGWTHYTLCSVPTYQILVGIFSGWDSVGYDFRLHLWKPPL